MPVTTIGKRLAIGISGNRGMAVFRVTGAATDDEPARIVLLRRHADMADETSWVDARRHVDVCADSLARALDETAHGAPDLLASLDAVQSVMHSDTYYSVLVAQIFESRVAAAGVGRVAVRLLRHDVNEEVVQPTVVSAGGVDVMAAALGVGYDRSRVRSLDLAVQPGDRIVAAVDMDVSRISAAELDHLSAEAAVNSLVTSADARRPAVVAVIAPGI